MSGNGLCAHIFATINTWSGRSKYLPGFRLGQAITSVLGRMQSTIMQASHLSFVLGYTGCHHIPCTSLDLVADKRALFLAMLHDERALSPREMTAVRGFMPSSIASICKMH